MTNDYELECAVMEAEYALLGMENCLDLAIRTEGAVGNVAPTIEQSFSRFLAARARLFGRKGQSERGDVTSCSRD